MPLAVPTQKRPPGKYASHPYPVLVDENAYLSSAQAMAITRRLVLQKQNIEDAYVSTATPLSIAVSSALISKSIDDDAYISTAMPLSIAILEPLIKREVKDAYLSSARPLAIKRKLTLISYEHPSDDAYLSSAKPINILIY